MKSFDFSIILTCTVNPIQMPNLVRSNPEIRFQDYKKSFNFWVNNAFVNKIILLENSNFDLSYFNEVAKNIKNKEIEIISSNSNNEYDKSLGKGYGQYLCLKEIFDQSQIAKTTKYFIDVTGRHCVKNFKAIIKDIIKNESDIYVNITDNLKFADANIYGGTKNFFINYLLPETKKTNDSQNKIFENCVASATLKAISDGMNLSKTPIYADIEGFIGTNGKKYKQSIIKKIKLFFFRKLKIYFFNHKKY
ncbi:hypothetical protein OAP22_02245 [Candidatus Pelagibacter ubique]|nr:hypothetical protein [Candidatus Pelagibacter ubique]